MYTFTVKTRRRTEFVDITPEVAKAVRESGISGGVCVVMVPHTTCGLTLNENADPSVRGDILDSLERIVPSSARYSHAEGNSDAHIKSSLTGHSVSCAVESGSLAPGTWQGVYLCEFDGPRTREVRVKILPDRFQNPFPTVDVIIETRGGVVLIKRKNPPRGWAIPGGFVDYNESLEDAALREMKEETCLDVKDLKQFHTYSAPGRDPRFHTVSTVFTGRGEGTPVAADDAADIGIFGEDSLPDEIAFDHRRILSDYFAAKKKADNRLKTGDKKRTQGSN